MRIWRPTKFLMMLMMLGATIGLAAGVAAAAELVINDPTIEFSGADTTIRVTLNRPAKLTARLSDARGLGTPFQSDSQIAAASHCFFISGLPAQTKFQLDLEAVTDDGETDKKGVGFKSETIDQPASAERSSPPADCLMFFNLDTDQATGSPSPGTTSTGPGRQPPSPTSADQTDGLQSPILAGLLGPVVKIGGQTLNVADLLFLLFLGLAASATLLEFFFYFKRRRLWGVVYDARTKTPVEMAVVRLFDQEHHKLLETRVTPRSGRYSFLVEPGEYYLEVTKESYHFPSRIVTQTIDNEYVNIYRGEVLKMGVGQSLVAPDIPIDSEAGEVKRAGLYRRVLFPALDRLRLPLILVALVMSLPAMGMVFKLQFRFKAFGLPMPPFLPPVLATILVVLLFVEFFLVRRGRK